MCWLRGGNICHLEVIREEPKDPSRGDHLEDLESEIIFQFRELPQEWGREMGQIAVSWTAGDARTRPRQRKRGPYYCLDE